MEGFLLGSEDKSEISHKVYDIDIALWAVLALLQFSVVIGSNFQDLAMMYYYVRILVIIVPSSLVYCSDCLPQYETNSMVHL